MRRQVAALIVGLIFAGVLGGCGTGLGGMRGSGTVISETRDVSGFNGIELLGNGTLIIEQSDKESLSVSTDDNLMPLIVTAVEGGTLKLHTKDSTIIDPSKGVTYTLLVKKLNTIGVSGGAEINAKGLQTDSLSIAVSGAGNITLTGETVDAKIAISGAGELHGEGFKSKDAAIRISGAGHAVLAVSDNLDVHVTGAGEVEYIGDPKVTQDITGAGSVVKRP